MPELLIIWVRLGDDTKINLLNGGEEMFEYKSFVTKINFLLICRVVAFFFFVFFFVFLYIEKYFCEKDKLLVYFHYYFPGLYRHGIRRPWRFT